MQNVVYTCVIFAYISQIGWRMCACAAHVCNLWLRKKFICGIMRIISHDYLDGSFLSHFVDCFYLHVYMSCVHQNKLPEWKNNLQLWSTYGHAWSWSPSHFNWLIRNSLIICHLNTVSIHKSWRNSDFFCTFAC